MSAGHTVEHVARLVTGHPQFTEKSVYASMAAAGVSDRDADLAYKFTQAAWGRLLLDGMGIKFAEGYYCLDANGDVVDSGKLAEQPHFIAATRLGPRYAAEAGFKRLAAMSADFHVVNQALNGGSRPENLVLAPLVLFLEPPTEAGMARAHRLISEALPRRSPGASPQSRSPRPSQTPPPQRTHVAEKTSWFQKLFRRGR